MNSFAPVTRHFSLAACHQPIVALHYSLFYKRPWGAELQLLNGISPKKSLSL